MGLRALNLILLDGGDPGHSRVQEVCRECRKSAGGVQGVQEVCISLNLAILTMHNRHTSDRVIYSVPAAHKNVRR